MSAVPRAVGLVHVVEERECGVSVVHDRRLDRLRERLHVGPSEILEGQVARLAGRGVVLRDREVESARREVRIGLAEAERAPLRMAERRPTFRVIGQGDDVGEAERLLGIAERLGHRLGHRDDQRRQHERRRWLGDRSFTGVDEALVDDGAPRARRGRPDHRLWTVRFGVRPAGRQQRGARARCLPGGTHEHALVADPREVRAVELLRELGHDGDLLGRRGHVDDDAVTGIGGREVVAGLIVVRRRTGRECGRCNHEQRNCAAS